MRRGKNKSVNKSKQDYILRASDLIGEIVKSQSDEKKKKSITYIWADKNPKTAQLLIDSCILAREKGVPLNRVFDRIKSLEDGPPGSYSTLKRFVDEQIREEQGRGSD
tara:strand:+ start:10125 stop:10448 length:324 start_codon:yes stop_codon:yes gene_type:complete